MTLNRRSRPVQITDAPEHRNIPLDRIEFRANEEDDNLFTIEGYASTFQEYEMYGGPANWGWIERIDPSAFDKTLREKPDLHLLINHAGTPLARTKSGTCRLEADDHGLKVIAELDKRDPESMGIFVKMERGDMDEMSFAFRVKAQEWRAADGFEEDNQSYRTITEVSLHKGDVSIVNWGANDTTSVGIRSVEDALRCIAECDEKELVEARSDEDLVRKAVEKLGPAAQRSIVNIENFHADGAEAGADFMRGLAEGMAGAAPELPDSANEAEEERDGVEGVTGTPVTLGPIVVSQRMEGAERAFRFDCIEKPGNEIEVEWTRSQVIFNARIFAQAVEDWRAADPEGMRRIDVGEAEMQRRREADPEAGGWSYPSEEEIDALIAAEDEPKRGISLRLAQALAED